MNYRHSMLARCLSVILSVFVVLTMMPTVAIAEENGDAQQVQQEQTESTPAPEPEKKEEKAEPAPEPVAEPEQPAAPEEPAPAVEEPAVEVAAAEESSPAVDVSSEEEQAAAPKEAKKEEQPKEEKKEEEKDEYPAQTLTANAGGVTVTLKAPEGALPKGAKLKAHQVGQQYINAVENTLEAQGRELTDAVAIDVTPVDKDGKEIQPKKSVSVTFSGTGLDLEAGDSVAFYRVSDDASSVTSMGGSGNANSGTFSTNHFTIYVDGGSTTNTNGDGTMNSQTNPLIVLNNGQSVTIRSGDWSRNWNIMTAGGSSYISLTNPDWRSVNVTNVNGTTTDQLVQIGHHSDNSETYWLLAKGKAPTTATIAFDPGEKGTWTAASETYADVNIGSATPTFGTKSSAKTTDCAAGYHFTVWDPDLESTVTGDQTYTAQWDPNTNTPYTVEFYYMNKDSGEYPDVADDSADRTGTTDTEAEVTADDKTPDPSKNGYELDEDKADDWSGNIDGDGSRVLKVYFKLSEYEVVYDPGEQGTWNADDQTYDGLNYGDDRPDFTGDTDTDHNPGWKFTGWDPGLEDTVTGDQTYIAQWEAEEYDITYNYAEGKEPPTANPDTYTVEGDITIDQEPTRDGYEFLGWTSDDMSKPITDPTTPVEWSAGDEIGDKTFTANWAKLYKLTYKENSEGDRATVPNEVENIAGETETLGKGTREGYVFEKWTTEPGGGGKSYGAGTDFTFPEEDTILYAQWSDNPIKVTYHRNDGSTGDQEIFFVDEDVASNNEHYATIADMPTRLNYLFTGWSKEQGSADGEFGPKAYCPTEDVNMDLYAIWMPFDESLIQIEGKKLTAKGKIVPYNGNEYTIKDVEEIDVDYGTPGHEDKERKYAGYVKVSAFSPDQSQVHHNIYAYIEPITASGTEAGSYNTPLVAQLFTHRENSGDPGIFDKLTTYGQGIEITNYTLTITPAKIEVETYDSTVESGETAKAGGKITVTSGSYEKSFEFNHEGTTLTFFDDDGGGETLFIKTTSERTEVGTEENKYQIDWNQSTARKNNYDTKNITEKLGTLKVVGNTVKYDGNASDASNVPEGTDEAEHKYTISDKVPTRTGYNFLYWTTDKEGKDTQYNPGDTYEFVDVKEVTFYAQWEAVEPEPVDPTMYEITYDPNGGVFRGSTDPVAIDYQEGEVITVAEAPTRDGYEFLYWKGSEYFPGEEYIVTEDHTFVAQWKKVAENKTDKKDTKNKKKKSVETGDSDFMTNWYILMILCQIVFIGMLAARIKRNRSE